MKIIIELPDDVYEDIIYGIGSIDDYHKKELVMEAINDGTRFPDKDSNVPKILTLENAVKVVSRKWGIDPLIVEQELEQKTYYPVYDVFGAGYYEGFNEAHRLLNESGIEITNNFLDSHDLRIDMIVDKINFLAQIISDQFEELKKEVEPQESEVEDFDNLDSMLEDLWNATVEDHRKYREDEE